MPADASTIFYTWSDRRFHELPLDRRQQTMREMDPQFAALPPKEQDSLLMQAYQKYYVQKAPPPPASALAMILSGVDPTGQQQPGTAPPAPQMEESTPGKMYADVEASSGVPDPRAQRRPLVPGARSAFMGPVQPQALMPDDSILRQGERMMPGPSLPGTGAQPPVPRQVPPPVVPGARVPSPAVPQPSVPGLLQPGNIDLWKRPVVQNPDGTVSTVRSISVGFDEGEVLIPTISDDGRTLTEEQAIDLYRRTGKHLGIFDNPEHATLAADRIHQGQADIYGKRPPVPPGKQSLFDRMMQAGTVQADFENQPYNREATGPPPPPPAAAPRPRLPNPPLPAPRIDMQERPLVPPDDPWLGKDATMLERTVNAPAVGMIQALTTGTIGAAGGATQALGALADSDRLRQAGKEMSSVSGGMQGALPGLEGDALTNPQLMLRPDWWTYQLGQGLGSMLPMMLAGGAGGAGINSLIQSGRLPAGMMAMLQKWGPSAVGGITEGMTAGALAYDEARQKGLSEPEALQQFAQIAAGTAVSAIPAYKMGAFAEGIRRPVPRGLATAAAEGIQEGPLQQTWENYVKGDPLMQGQIESITGGVLGGGGTGLAMGRVEPPPRTRARDRYGRVNYAPRPQDAGPVRKGPYSAEEAAEAFAEPPAEPAPPPLPPAPPSAPPFEETGAPYPLPEGVRSARESAEAIEAELQRKARRQQQELIREERKAQRPEVPETGIPENIARGQAKREDLAILYTGKPWKDIDNSERIFIDDRIAEGETGASAIGGEPVTSSFVPTNEEAKQEAAPPNAPISALVAPPTAPVNAPIADPPVAAPSTPVAVPSTQVEAAPEVPLPAQVTEPALPRVIKPAKEGNLEAVLTHIPDWNHQGPHISVRFRDPESDNFLDDVRVFPADREADAETWATQRINGGTAAPQDRTGQWAARVSHKNGTEYSPVWFPTKAAAKKYVDSLKLEGSVLRAEITPPEKPVTPKGIVPGARQPDPLVAQFRARLTTPDQGSWDAHVIGKTAEGLAKMATTIGKQPWIDPNVLRKGKSGEVQRGVNDDLKQLVDWGELQIAWTPEGYPRYARPGVPLGEGLLTAEQVPAEEPTPAVPAAKAKKAAVVPGARVKRTGPPTPAEVDAERVRHAMEAEGTTPAGQPFGAGLTAKLNALIPTAGELTEPQVKRLEEHAGSVVAYILGENPDVEKPPQVNEVIDAAAKLRKAYDAANPPNEAKGVVPGTKASASGKKPKKPSAVVPGAKPATIPEEQPGGRETVSGTEGIADTGAAGEVTPVRGPRKPGSAPAHGTAATVRVPGESATYKSHYAVREAADVVASHSGQTFQANPEYQHHNERDYSDPANQERVVVNSTPARFDPAYLINDNPDATNGPPIIDSSGNVLGGNSRRMIFERVHAQKDHPGQKAYRDMLMAKARQFGIDPKQIEGMKQPILVRELDHVEASAQEAITDFNKVGTAALTASERAASGAAALSDDMIDYLGGLIESTGPTATLNDVLTGRSGAQVINRMVEEGVFTMQQKPSLLDSRTGGTTSEAREQIADMLLGRMFRDSDQIRRTPPAVRNKLERIVAPLLRVQSRPEWNLIPDFRDAMDLLEYARAHDITSLEDVVRQQDLFGSAPEFSDRAVALAQAIKDKTQLELAQAVKKYAADSVPNMFGEVGPSEAFVDAFGTGEPGLLERISDAGKKAVSQRRRETQRGSFSLRKVPQKQLSPEHKFINQDVEDAITAASTPPPRQDIIDKAQEMGAAWKNSFTRTHRHLDRKTFYPLIWQMTQQAKNAPIASQTAQENIQNILGDLDVNQQKTFARKVLLDDLLETYEKWKAEGELPPGADDLFQLAFKLTPEKMRQELPPLNAMVSADPMIKDALRRRKAIVTPVQKEHMAAMKAIGHDLTDTYTRDYYYRHRVLSHMKDPAGKTGLGTGAPKVPGGRSSLKKRGVGAAGEDYSTDYITSEFEVMSQMIRDTRVAKYIKWLEDSKYNIQPELARKAAAQTAALRAVDPNAKAVDWRDLIDKDTHDEFHPDQKHVFYLTHTLPERMAEDILNNTLQTFGVTASDLKKAIAMGGMKTGIVLPNEVIRTFDELKARPYDPAEMAYFKVFSLWKQVMLNAPWRFIKSQSRNQTGDNENTLGGNHEAFGKAKTSIKHLLAYYRSLKEGKPQMDQNLRDWFSRGGFQSSQVVNELGDLRGIEKLEKFLSQGAPPVVPGARQIAGKILGAPVRWTKRVFDAAGTKASQREAILRYANYLEYLDQLRANGVPNRYGRSKKEEVDALDSIEDKAYKLSNDLLGAYDETSVAGQRLSKAGFPFWRFQEHNVKGYLQYYRNVSRDPQTATKVGRYMLRRIGAAGLARSPYIAYRVGAQTVKLAGLWALAQTFSRLWAPDDDDKLRQEIRARPHVTFGHWPDGSVMYFPNLGNLPDLADWVDPEELVQAIKDVMNGKMGFLDAAAHYAMGSIGEKMLSGSNPAFKITYEYLTKRTLFPNVNEPRNIPDRTEYLAQQLGLGGAYKQLSGKPVPLTSRSLPERALRAASSLLIYETMPGLSATYSNLDRVNQYKADHGISRGGGGAQTLRSDPLRNMMMALRLEDKTAFSKYIGQYFANGGTEKGLATSIKDLHPLHGLTKKQQEGYRNSLNDEDAKKLDLAIQFYEETFGPARLEQYKLESAEQINEGEAVWAEKEAAAGR